MLKNSLVAEETDEHVSPRTVNNGHGVICRVQGPFEPHPVRLIPAERNRATEAYGAVRFAPPVARIVAVGGHPYLPFMSAVVWVSERNEIVAAVESDNYDVGRDVLVRIWGLHSAGINRAVALKRHGRGSAGFANFGAWDGMPLAGVILFPLDRPCEEQ